MTQTETREQWLDTAVDRMRGFFEEAEAKVPEVVRVSTGWSRGAKPNSVGWCWKSEVASDASSNVFISPEINEPVTVLAVLLHEMSHAADDCQSKHGGRFKRLWRYHGFVGKPTTSVPGEQLFERLTSLAVDLGPYPHAKLTPTMQVKIAKTYMLKIECPTCGYVCRSTQKWVETGLPVCCCGDQMELAD